MVTRLQFPVQSSADFAQLRQQFVTLPAKSKLMTSRDQGIDISSPGRQSLSLLVGEETAGALYATDVYLSPGFGAPPHHQPTEDELWYLLEGTLDARVGLRTVSLTPGAFAYIPRDTTHTFRNNGSGPVRLLAWNAPGGHERAFEAMRDKARQGITDFPSLRGVMSDHGIELHAQADEVAPNDHPRDAPAGRVLLDRSEGREASSDNANIRILLDRMQSGDRYEVRDVVLSQGSAGLQLGTDHAHACFYVLAGDVAVTLDDDRRRVGPGAFGYAPPGSSASVAPVNGDVHMVTWTVAPERRRGAR